jgi:hypothetical protein
MAFTETLADFLDTTHGFAVNATLGAATVPVIFDAAFADVLGIVAATQPVALGTTADLSAAAVGGTITINAVAYTVAEIQPDGTGMTRLVLKT